MSSRDTIAAIATAPGRAGIGVVRISGSRVPTLIEGLTAHTLAPRRAVLTAFRDAKGGAIDEGIAVYYPAPRSYTGEHVLELQGHGGPVVLRLLLQRCIELGARVAAPGEFTQRAFLNGKMDLAQAESVADIIDAATAQAARCAMRSLQGEFSSRIQSLKEPLIELRVLVEATLDFPEEDVAFLEQASAHQRLDSIRARLTAVLEAARQGSLLREGLHIVLAGQPNVGKSSLLNRLAGDDLAIVTDVPGTTRDPIREVVDIGGVPAHIVDTAGLRESKDPVERIGVERAWKAIERADAVVLIVDATAGVAEADRAIVGRLPAHLPRVRVMNKIDLIGHGAGIEERAGETVVWLSAKSGAGVDLLERVLLKVAGWQAHGESAFLARERHLLALHDAAEHLERAAAETGHLELLAEELRLAQEQFSAITGEFTADELLGEIFSRFCIGK